MPDPGHTRASGAKQTPKALKHMLAHQLHLFACCTHHPDKNQPINQPTPRTGPLQPHRPRRSNRAPAADRKPVTAFVNYTGTAFGQQPTSERINAPGYTFGDPTISTVDKRDRQVELMQAADAGDVYAERPQSPRLSERFPARNDDVCTRCCCSLPRANPQHTQNNRHTLQHQ